MVVAGFRCVLRRAECSLAKVVALKGGYRQNHQNPNQLN